MEHTRAVGCVGADERAGSVTRACRSDHRCACATGLTKRRHGCAALRLPAQCSLAQLAIAQTALHRGSLVEACPYLGPYHTKSENLQDYELLLTGPDGGSILPLGSCAAVQMVTAAAANVVLEVEATSKHVLMIARHFIRPGDELRAAAAPCYRQPQPMRAPPHNSTHSEWCPPIEVGRSSLHGRGVFATASIAAGTEIAASCPLVLGSLHSYTFAHAPLSRQHGVNVQVTSLGPCSLVNHACVRGRANARWSFDGEQQRMWALKNVSAGEELLWDYGESFTDREPLCQR